MQKNFVFHRCALASILVLGTQLGIAAEDAVTAGQAVAAIERTFGVTPGERRNHTKGTCALGEFVGSPSVAAYSRSALFSGSPIPVVARFSLAGGNPKVPDNAKSARGMALEFKLSGGAVQHMTMLNTPMAPVANPRAFVDLMMAMKPDPATGRPDPEKMKALRTIHPDTKAQADFLAEHNPPVSYANSSYFGIHTFKFVNDKNTTTIVRWRFVPRDGEKRLDISEMKSAPHDFLEQDLIARTGKGPVQWDMMVWIGEPGDTQDNPTIAWPDSRKQVKAGTLTISAAMPQKEAACEKINFDPLIMADGIAASDDPVLLFRSPAYAVSFAKRISGM